MNKFKQNIQLINEQIILKNPKEVIPTYQKSKQKSHAELVGGKLEVMLKIFKPFSECSQHLITVFCKTVLRHLLQSNKTFEMYGNNSIKFRKIKSFIHLPCGQIMSSQQNFAVAALTTLFPVQKERVGSASTNDYNKSFGFVQTLAFYSSGLSWQYA